MSFVSLSKVRLMLRWFLWNTVAQSHSVGFSVPNFTQNGRDSFTP